MIVAVIILLVSKPRGVANNYPLYLESKLNFAGEEFYVIYVVDFRYNEIRQHKHM